MRAGEKSHGLDRERKMMDRLTSRVPSVSAWLSAGIMTLAAMAFAMVVGVSGASAAVDYAFTPGTQTFVPSGPAAHTAGGHPDVTVEFKLETDPAIGTGRAAAVTRDSGIVLPVGMLGDPSSLDICSIDDVVANEVSATAGRCPRRSAAGVAAIDATYPNGNLIPLQQRRLYRVAAGPDEIAAFATSVLNVPVRIAATVNPEGGYRVFAELPL